MAFMEKFYQTTLNALKDANNDVSHDSLGHCFVLLNLLYVRIIKNMALTLPNPRKLVTWNIALVGEDELEAG